MKLIAVLGSSFLVVVTTLALQAAAIPSAASESPRTVMTWIQTSVKLWPTARDFFTTGAGKGAINAVSIGDMMEIDSTTGYLDINDPLLRAHTDLWLPTGFRTYPMLGFGGHVAALRNGRVFGNATLIQALANVTREGQFSGLNIDFEPTTNVHDPLDPASPTAQDALDFAAFIDALARALHALPNGGATLQVDTESIGGACWNDPGNNHTWDRKPCPWIRRFWNMDALATTAVDTILPMDTYGTNDTQLPFFLEYYQHFFDIDRIGWGVWATKDTPIVSTPAFVESRMGPFKQYSSKMVAVWCWGDVGEAGLETLQKMEAKWAPWIPQLRAFLEAED
jgi:hypothetical protein